MNESDSRPDADGWYPDPEDKPAPRPARGNAPVPAIDIGEVLGLAFKIFFKSLPKLFPLALLIFTPYFLVELIFPGYLSPDEFVLQEEPEQFVLAFFTAILLSAGLGQLLTAGVCYEALERTRGRSAPLGQLLGVGFERFLPVFWMSFMLGWIVMFGFMLIIVPGIIFAVMYWVAVPICVVERPGPFRSLGRSRELTKGNRWQVFALMIISGMVGGAAGLPIGIVQEIVSDPSLKQIFALVMVLVTAVIGIFNGVIVSVTYSQLREKKEGATSDELLEIFS